MKCPNDAATLVMSERSGVEIDYCPECRGVWLDRGELDKILDRAAAESSPVPPPAQPQAPFVPEPEYRSRYSEPFPESRSDRLDDDRRESDRSYGHRPPGGYGDRYGQGQGQYRRKRKESWLSELFD
jgi:Zn-finger nucleic acid-binding protein